MHNETYRVRKWTIWCTQVRYPTRSTRVMQCGPNNVVFSIAFCTKIFTHNSIGSPDIMPPTSMLHECTSKYDKKCELTQYALFGATKKQGIPDTPSMRSGPEEQRRQISSATRVTKWGRGRTCKRRPQPYERVINGCLEVQQRRLWTAYTYRNSYPVRLITRTSFSTCQVSPHEGQEAPCHDS